MTGFIAFMLFLAAVAGGCFYGLAYLRAKNAGIRVSAAMLQMIQKVLGA